MWKRSLNIAILCGSWIFFLLVSCVDQSYDLSKDIDLTMAVGGEKLALPVGDTEPMLLSQFVEENELLQEEEGGTYKLLKEEEMESAEVFVKNVTITVMPTELDDVNDIPPIPSGSAPDTPIGDLPELNPGGTLVLENSDMPEEIISIYSLTPGRIDSKLPQVSLAFNISEKKDKSLTAIKEVLLNNFTLTLPKCLVLEGNQITSKKEFQDSEGIYYCKYTIGSASFSPTNPDVFSLDLTLISFGSDEKEGLEITPIEGDPGKRGFKQEYNNVSLTSNITILLSSAPEEELELVLTPTVSISPISIASVTGQIKPTLEKSTLVELGELPDFLTDPEVRLDLANPQIFLTVDNPIDIQISFYVTMQGVKGGENPPRAPIETPKITIPAKQITTIILSKEEVEATDVVNPKPYIIDNLNELFLPTMPGEIQLKILSKKVYPTEDEITAEKEADKKLPRSTIVLGVSENVKMEYKIDMPLAFGPTFAIVLKDTLNGLNDNLKDSDVKGIKITMDVDNAIPLALTIGGEAIDKEGNRLKGITIEGDGKKPTGADTKPIKTIKPYTGETKINDDSEVVPKPVTTEGIIINIKEKTGGSGQLKKMDGIVLKFKAESNTDAEGKSLSSQQYLKMKNISAEISGGISLDLN